MSWKLRCMAPVISPACSNAAIDWRRPPATLALSVRSDVLWTPWALIVVTGISLWVHAHTAHRWRVEPQDLGVYAAGWSAVLGLTLALSPLLRRWSGAGAWALRTTVTLATIMITSTAVGGLFRDSVTPLYWLGLLLLALAGMGLASRQLFEIFGLSAISLGLNTLLILGLGRALFHNSHGDNWFGAMLLLGLVAAGLLAGTVSLLLRLSRRYGEHQETQHEA